MAINYSAVGVLIGDPNNTLFVTESIDALSTLVGENSYALAAACARALASTFAGQVNKKSGDVSIDASDKYTHYMAMAKDLDKQASLRSLGGASVYAGGISQSDKATRESNTDRVTPYFTRTLHDDPDSSSDDVTGHE